MTWIKKHKLIVGIIILIIAGASYYFFFYKNSDDNSAKLTTKTEEVIQSDIEVLVTGSGQVEADSQVDLKPVAAGDAIEVMAVYVENDQEVKKDQVIALLDSEDAQKSIRDAEISLRSAQIQLKQTEKQNDTKTEEDKWTRQLQEISVQQRTNSLADAREKLQDYYIKAPFDGIVTDLAVEAGDTISQSDVLASVITKELVASVTLNEVDAAQVKVGNKVALAFDALPDIEASGTVSKVDTIGEVVSGVVSYGVEITFESPSVYLKPGMSVNAEIQIAKSGKALVISSSAIKTDNQGNKFVLVISGNDSDSQSDSSGESSKNSLEVNMNLGNSSATNNASLNQYKRVAIETGLSNDTQTEILSGLLEGDVILLSSSTSSTASSSTSSSSPSSSGLLNMGGGPGGGGRR